MGPSETDKSCSSLPSSESCILEVSLGIVVVPVFRGKLGRGEEESVFWRMEWRFTGGEMIFVTARRLGRFFVEEGAGIDSTDELVVPLLLLLFRIILFGGTMLGSPTQPGLGHSTNWMGLQPCGC